MADVLGRELSPPDGLALVRAVLLKQTADVQTITANLSTEAHDAAVAVAAGVVAWLQAAEDDQRVAVSIADMLQARPFLGYPG